VVDIDTDDVGSFGWRRDSKGIVASVVQKARYWLYAVSLEGKYRRFTDAPVNGGDFDLAPDGAAVVAAAASRVHPKSSPSGPAPSPRA